MSARTRPLAWFGILAMLAQLLLPTLHAAAYAQRHGDPLAYAICGAGSPALRALLRERLPAEVVDRLDAQAAAPQLPDCALCGAVHAGAGPGASVVAPLPTAAHPGLRPLPAVTVATDQATRPPVRGPPAPG